MNHKITKNIKSIVESFLLPYVQKPMRYAGGELNCIRKNLSEVTLHGILCFPDLYDIGMSHTGLQLLYHIVNSSKEWALSRAFHPWEDAEAIMRERNIPLYSLEYFTPLYEADIVGFSVQYELHFTNIVNMLDLGGIPLLAKNRDDRHPLIIAGGPCVGNPEPLASFVDAFVIGDGEEAIAAIFRIVEQAKTEGFDRKRLLLHLSEIEGVYVPALYDVMKNGCFQIAYAANGKVVRAAKISHLQSANYPEKPIVPLVEIVHRRMAVEVMRGCTRGCRFCSAGMYYRPVRERSPEDIERQITSAIAVTGWQDIGLLSLSTADYSALSTLLEKLATLKYSHQISCALPSTRLDALTTPQLDLLEKVSSVSSFTIAPEAGSERLRKVINKDFSDDTIYNAVHRLMQRNVQTLKLYFMLGLPTENNDDIEAIITMVSRISGIVRAVSRRRSINVSLSPFSPKPHTPFQWEAMDTTENLLEKGALIKRKLRYCKNVSVAYRNPQLTVLETLLARGDRRVGELVHHVWKKGARFDGWEECFNIQRWYESAAELSINIDNYLQRIEEEQTLPWEVVSTGVSQTFLQQEQQNAYQERITADCRDGTCCKCGLCTKEIKPSFAESAMVEKKMHQPERIDSDNRKTDVYRYRFTYSKTETMRFLGHLDMVRLLHRACLMAKLPLVYTQGYHPHPKISFGPPLPFSIAGTNESFDVTVKEELEIDPFTLNRWLPEGLQIKEYCLLTEPKMALNAMITAGHYVFVPLYSINNIELEQRISELLSREEILLTVEKKRKKIAKDVRSGILSLEIIEKPKIGWKAVLSLKAPHSCRPVDLLKILYPEVPFSNVTVTREECLQR